MAGQPITELPQIESWLRDELLLAMPALTQIGQAVTAPNGSAVAQIATDAAELRLASRRIDATLVASAGELAKSSADGRLVLALIQLSQQGGLIANQFELIGEQLSEIDPDVLDRARTAEKLSEMTGLAAIQLQTALAAFTARDLKLAQTLDQQDDLLDRLNRDVFEATLDLDAPRDQRELALRHVMIARSLERIGDNAVDIGEQAAFLVTAEVQEFSDASKPRRRGRAVTDQL